MDPAKTEQCLDPEQLAAYVDGRCGPDDKRRVEGHVDGCVSCRKDLSALVAAMQNSHTEVARPQRADATPVPQRPSAMLKAGDALGPYQVVELLGAGGMGAVYRARDERLHRDVALKILPAEVRADPDARQRFKREARAVGSLNHPNVLVVYDVDVDAPMPYVVTELLAGMTLRKRLELRPLSPREVAEYGVQIVRGLVAAHDKGIIHRDLKPENLFLTSEGVVKILDFGLAKRLPAATDATEAEVSMATTPGAMMGTAGYMSPEQVHGEEVDARTDIFSLGVVLFELASGRRPFEGGTFGAICAAILHEPAPALAPLCRESPGALEPVILRCLAKRAQERYTARELLSALTVSSGPMPSVITERPRARRRGMRGALLVLASALAIIGAFAVGWSVRGHRTAPAAPAATAARWPALVEGGPEHVRVTYRSQPEWFARFGSDATSVVYSQRDRGSLRVMRSEIGRATALDLGLTGRVLDIARDGALALSPDSEEGLLAIATPGAGASRELARNVEAASFGPTTESIAITRHDGAAAIVEYPIGHSILRRDNVDFSDVRVSRDGHRLAVIELMAPPDTRGHVLVLDEKGTELGRSPDYPSIEGVAWSPDDREVWLSSIDVLRAFAPGAPDRVLLRATGYLMLRDVAADGRILVAPTDPHVRVLEGPAKAPAEEVGWLDACHVRTMADDGSALGLVEGVGIGTAEGYRVYVRRGDTSPVAIGRGFDVALAPDGSFAVLLSGTGDRLRFVPIGPGAARSIRIDPVVTFDFSTWMEVSADGKRVFARGAAARQPMRLWAFDIAGTAPAQPIGPDALVRDSSAHFRFAVSPDGASIAVPTSTTIGVLRTAGAGPVRQLASTEGYMPLRFTRDGKALFAWSTHGWPRMLVRVDLAGAEKPVTIATLDPPIKPYSARAEVSADGGTVAFSFVDLTSDLYVLAPPH